MVSVDNRKKGEGGFTLIEVMIALLLLLIGVSGVLSLQMVSMRATSFSRHATEATIVAEDKMEDLMLQSAASLADGVDLVDSQGNLDPGGAYTRTWTVEPTGSILLLTITVSWFEKGTEPHGISIATQRRL